MSQRVDQIRRAIKGIVSDIVNNPSSTDARRIKIAAGEAVTALVKADYLAKGHTQRGTDGITWDRTKRLETDGPPMMVDTGRLLASLAYSVTERGVEVSFDTPYAKYALANRPAWPLGGPVPDSYYQTIIEAITPILKEIIARRIRECFGSTTRSS